jgi:hypothetical protein
MDEEVVSEMRTRIAFLELEINEDKKEVNRLLVILGEPEKYFVRESE